MPYDICYTVTTAHGPLPYKVTKPNIMIHCAWTELEIRLHQL